ncbi:MAG: tRNA-queuosine alpha-mannosyltransferase domain-containing protein [Planctomycetales bacterium]|jgi:glycosyltransferase involved in cell wall biosynthesis
MTRRILALNPWHGGSHQAFLDGWVTHSRHKFTVLPLPAYKWKWRMRHSAVTFSQQLLDLHGDRASAAPQWDVLFCTDMLGLAEFRGLCPESVRQLPSIVYFHENQLTYPTQQDEERDFHFAYSNMTSALAADTVWFNSDYHRDEFLTALGALLRRMPDFGHEESVDQVLAKSEIQHPGFDAPSAGSTAERVERPTEPLTDRPLRIVWASRWEHDKNPELFFAALDELSRLNVPFEVSVLGESFRNSPSCFDDAKGRLSSQIRHWGFAESRAEYLRILSESDVVVSTARHEFFGISVLEAVAAGCRPLVPNALAYPETLGANLSSFHDGTAAGIARSLATMAKALNSPNAAADSLLGNARPNVERFFWETRSSELDAAVDRLCEHA